MQMRTGGASSAAAERDRLSFGDMLSFLDAHLGKVQIESEQSLPVINHDAVAFEVEWLRQNHGAGVDRGNLGAGGNAKIESLMRTLHRAVEDALHSEDVGNVGGDRTLE